MGQRENPPLNPLLRTWAQLGNTPSPSVGFGSTGGLVTSGLLHGQENLKRLLAFEILFWQSYREDFSRKDTIVKRPTLFQQIEKQAEEEGKHWKRKRMEELIEEHAGDAGISPPQQSGAGEKQGDRH